MKKIWVLIGSVVVLGVITGVYFYIQDDSYATEEAKLALMNHPLMTQKYADEELHIIGTSYSTVMCDFKLNGISASFPRSVIDNNRAGELNYRTDHYIPESNLWLDYGNNVLTIDAMAPIHYPRDGTYFFCEGRAMGENIHLNVSGANDPFADSGRTKTQQIIATNDPRYKKPVVDYTDVSWHIYKSKSDDNNLDIIYRDTKRFEESLLNDVSVSTNFNLEKSKENLPSPIFWRDSEPFEATPENMELLWQAYEELLVAFESQKQSEILKVLDFGLIQSELVIGDPKRLIFVNYDLENIQKNWDQYGFKRGAKDKLEDYELRIADHKKLFKLVLKNNDQFEPVHFKLPGQEDRYFIYKFYFTMVDGKPKVAFVER